MDPQSPSVPVGAGSLPAAVVPHSPTISLSPNGLRDNAATAAIDEEYNSQGLFINTTSDATDETDIPLRQRAAVVRVFGPKTPASPSYVGEPSAPPPSPPTSATKPPWRHCLTTSPPKYPSYVPPPPASDVSPAKVYQRVPIGAADGATGAIQSPTKYYNSNDGNQSVDQRSSIPINAAAATGATQSPIKYYNSNQSFDQKSSIPINAVAATGATQGPTKYYNSNQSFDQRSSIPINAVAATGATQSPTKYYNSNQSVDQRSSIPINAVAAGTQSPTKYYNSNGGSLSFDQRSPLIGSPTKSGLPGSAGGVSPGGNPNTKFQMHLSKVASDLVEILDQVSNQGSPTPSMSGRGGTQ